VEEMISLKSSRVNDEAIEQGRVVGEGKGGDLFGRVHSGCLSNVFGVVAFVRCVARLL